MQANADVLTPKRRTIPENIANIKESLGEIARIEGEHVRDVLDGQRGRVHDAQVRLEDVVARRPLRYLALAAGAGLGLGWVLARRR